MKSLSIEMLSEAISPITHMSHTAGNEAIIAREPVVTSDGLAWVPFLSGNALRHRLVREPGMIFLIDLYGLKGKLSLDKLNFLIHGGNLTKSTATENTRRIAEMHRSWPLLRLLGGCLPNQIFPGSMDVWRGSLLCEENRTSLSHLPFSKKRLLSAESYVSSYQYTRGDAAQQGLGSDEVREGTSNLMIFSGQSVQRGALFYHGFTLKHVSEIEIGALICSLRLWKKAGGTIGGQASRGHGRLRSWILSEDIDQAALCTAYMDYVLSIKKDALSWLAEAWA